MMTIHEFMLANIYGYPVMLVNENHVNFSSKKQVLEQLNDDCLCSDSFQTDSYCYLTLQAVVMLRGTVETKQ